MIKHIYIALGVLVLAMAAAAYLVNLRQSAMQEQLRRDVLARIEQIEKQDQKAEQVKHETLQKIEKVQRAIKTPDDVVHSLPLINSPFAGTVAIAPPALPNAPSQIIVTDPQGFFNAAAECAGSKAELAACQVHLEGATEKAKLQEQRAEAAEKVMKGGGFLERLKRNAKWFVIGAGAGAATGYVLSH